jgi:hypothetical protein
VPELATPRSSVGGTATTSEMKWLAKSLLPDELATSKFVLMALSFLCQN